MLHLIDTTTRGRTWEEAFPGRILSVASNWSVEVRGDDIVLAHLSDLRASLGKEGTVEGVVSNPAIQNFGQRLVAAPRSPRVVVFSGTRQGPGSVQGILRRVAADYFPGLPPERITFLPCVVGRDETAAGLRDIVERFLPGWNDTAVPDLVPVARHAEFIPAFGVLLDAWKFHAQRSIGSDYWFNPFGLAGGVTVAAELAESTPQEMQEEVRRFLVERLSAAPDSGQLEKLRSLLGMVAPTPQAIPVELQHGVVFGDGVYAHALAQALGARKVTWSEKDGAWKPAARSKVPIRTPAILVLPATAGIGLALRQYRAAWASGHHGDCKSAIVCLNGNLVQALAGRDIFGRNGESRDKFSDWHARIGLVAATPGLGGLLSVLQASQYFPFSTWGEFANRADVMPKFRAALAAREVGRLLAIVAEARRLDWVTLLDDHKRGRQAVAWLETVTPGVTLSWREADAIFGQLK